jgi:hypothetical protein
MLHDTSYLPSWRGMDAYWDGEPSKNDLPIYIFFAYDNLGTLLDMVAGAFRRARALTNKTEVLYSWSHQIPASTIRHQPVEECEPVGGACTVAVREPQTLTPPSTEHR